MLWQRHGGLWHFSLLSTGVTPWPSDGGELSCAGRWPPTSHLTSISGPNFHSHSRQVLSLPLSRAHVCTHSSGHNPKHVSESHSGATVLRNPIWPVTRSLLLLYGRGGGGVGVNHTTVRESEHREDTQAPAAGLTAWALSDAVVLSVPVPQQQGGIPGARQDVAVPTDVRLGPGQTGHHVTVAEHDLSQFACKSKKNPPKNRLI